MKRGAKKKKKKKKLQAFRKRRHLHVVDLRHRPVKRTIDYYEMSLVVLRCTSTHGMKFVGLIGSEIQPFISACDIRCFSEYTIIYYGYTDAMITTVHKHKSKRAVRVWLK